jgi:hypothetical protein
VKRIWLGLNFGAFARQRLLDLDDQFRPGEDLVRRLNQVRAGGGVVGIIDPRPVARRLLDDHAMTARRQLPHDRRNKTDAVFVVLDLLRHSDQHGKLLPLATRRS